jgi:hypothetical protein
MKVAVDMLNAMQGFDLPESAGVPGPGQCLEVG